MYLGCYSSFFSYKTQSYTFYSLFGSFCPFLLQKIIKFADIQFFTYLCSLRLRLWQRAITKKRTKLFSSRRPQKKAFTPQHKVCSTRCYNQARATEPRSVASYRYTTRACSSMARCLMTTPNRATLTPFALPTSSPVGRLPSPRCVLATSGASTYLPRWATVLPM